MQHNTVYYSSLFRLINITNNRWVYYEKISLIVIVFMLTFSLAFSQEETKKPNAFLDYMKGRSAVGFNFIPSFSTLFINLSMDALAKPILETQLSDQGFNESMDSKFGGFGMIFSYEFTVLPYLVLAVDTGFVNSSLEMTSSSGGANFSMKYGLVPYSFGIKFFTGRNAPWGFYLYPKIGGTVFNATFQGDLNNEGTDTGGVDTTQSQTESFNTHGVYASLEIGWRIQLFPKMGKDWPVQVGIDIALFDLGYYFVPWMPDSIRGQSLIPDEYGPLANIRFLPMPKLGFTIRF